MPWTRGSCRPNHRIDPNQGRLELQEILSVDRLIQLWVNNHRLLTNELSELIFIPLGDYTDSKDAGHYVRVDKKDDR